MFTLLSVSGAAVSGAAGSVCFGFLIFQFGKLEGFWVGFFWGGRQRRLRTGNRALNESLSARKQANQAENQDASQLKHATPAPAEPNIETRSRLPATAPDKHTEALHGKMD